MLHFRRKKEEAETYSETEKEKYLTCAANSAGRETTTQYM